MNKFFWLLSASLLMQGCGADGKDAEPPPPSLVSSSFVLAGEECATGGVEVRFGVDGNSNSILDPNEVDESQTQVICHGGDGASAMVVAGELEQVENCTSSQGYKLTLGIDSNDDGLLTGDEISGVEAVCDGRAGTDGFATITSSKVLEEDNALYAQCAPNGGVVFENGLDVNRDGSLTSEEVSSTQVVCHGSTGSTGLSSLFVSTAMDEKSEYWEQCAGNGGLVWLTGLDENRNALLDDSEISANFVVCNGNEGIKGTDAFVEVTPIALGDEHCIAGGYLIETGVGEQVTHTEYVCLPTADDVLIALPSVYEVYGNTTLDGVLSSTSDSENLSYELIQEPDQGVLVLLPSGSFQYTPNTNETFSDSFLIKVSDGDTVSDTAQIQIYVNERNIAPELSVSGVFAVDEDNQLTGAIGVSDVNGDSVRLNIITPPDHGHLALTADGSFVYSPDADFNGTDRYVVRGDDGDLVGDNLEVVIQVSPVNDAPVATVQTVSVYQSSAVRGTFTANDVDSHDLTFTVDSQPAYGELEVDGSNFTYRPSRSLSDTDEFTFTVTDEFGASASAMVSIQMVTSVLSIEPAEGFIVTHEAHGVADERIKIFNTGMTDTTLSLGINGYQRRIRLSLSATSLFIGAGEYQEVILRADLEGHEAGDLVKNGIFVKSSEPGNPRVVLPLEITVTEDTTPPGEVSDLMVTVETFDSVNVDWTAVADSGYLGRKATAYDLRYSSAEITDDNWSSAIPVSVGAPSYPGDMERASIDGLEALKTYYAAIKVSDEEGNISTLSSVIEFTMPDLPIAETSVDSLSLKLPKDNIEPLTLTLKNTGDSKLIYSLVAKSDETVIGSVRKPAIRARNSMNAYFPKGVAFKEGELLVKMLEGDLSVRAESMRTQLSAKVTAKIEDIDVEVWQVPAKTQDELFSVIEQLSSSGAVAYAEPNYIQSIDAVPDDPSFNDLWGLHNEGQSSGTADADIDALEAWGIETGSQDVVVAVIDTGIDYNHIDLVDNMWTNEDEIPGNGIDDDNNGYIDDYYGYDFAYNDSNPWDGHAHGTHCAGTIGAVGNNQIGVVGVNHSVRMMAIKFLSDSGSGSTSNAIDAVMYGVDNGADILSNSWGGRAYSQALHDAIVYANQQGVLFVAAAGNDSSNNDVYPQYPANYDVPNVLSVAATDHNDALAGFSNYGVTTVDVAAPGVSILSTVPGNSYDSFNGTSMATPHVAGVAALLLARNPELNSDQLKSMLMDSVDPVSGLSGYMVTGGRLNAYSALQMAETPWLSVEGSDAGELESGASVEITLAVDGKGLMLGDYLGELFIETNNPDQGTLTIPVNLEIIPDQIPPAKVEDLVVSEFSSSSVNLSWTAVGDDGFEGGSALSYDIRISTTEITEDSWADAEQVVNSLSPGLPYESESFLVTELSPVSTYYLAVKVGDDSGQYSELSNVVSVTTSAAPALRLDPVSLDDITLSEGGTSSQELTLFNDGGDTLTFMAGLGSIASDQRQVVMRDGGISTTERGSVGDTATEAFIDDNAKVVLVKDIDAWGAASNEQVLQNLGIAYSVIGSNELDELDLSPYRLMIVASDQPQSLYDMFDENLSRIESWVSAGGVLQFHASDDGWGSGMWNTLPGGVTHVDYSSTYGDVHDEEHPIVQNIPARFVGNYATLCYMSNVPDNAGVITIDSADHPTTVEYLYGTGLVIPSCLTFEWAYSHDQDFAPMLTDLIAYSLDRAGQWLSLDTLEGEVLPGESMTINLGYNANSLDIGEYQQNLIIKTNDPSNPTVELPATLIVE